MLLPYPIRYCNYFFTHTDFLTPLLAGTVFSHAYLWSVWMSVFLLSKAKVLHLSFSESVNGWGVRGSDPVHPGIHTYCPVDHGIDMANAVGRMHSNGIHWCVNMSIISTSLIYRVKATKNKFPVKHCFINFWHHCGEQLCRNISAELTILQ